MAAQTLQIQLKNSTSKLMRITGVQLDAGSQWTPYNPQDSELSGGSSVNFGVQGAAALGFTLNILMGGSQSTITVQRPVGGAVVQNVTFGNVPGFNAVQYTLRRQVAPDGNTIILTVEQEMFG